jgi:hypothetical protein
MSSTTISTVLLKGFLYNFLFYAPHLKQAVKKSAHFGTGCSLARTAWPESLPKPPPRTHAGKAARI